MQKLNAILVAEDDDDDFFFLELALRSAGFRGEIVRARDGTEAIYHLSHPDEGELKLPAVALLDLKMPRASGFDVLRWKLENRELPCVPLIVLSSSPMDSDIEQAYALGALGYTVKSATIPERKVFCEGLLDWWAKHCWLPSSS